MQNNEWILSRPIAHRGLHDSVIPENSMPAFEAAMAAGYSVEIDVQLTKDKIPVVFHDDNVKRVTGVNKRLTRMKFADLRKLRLKGSEYGIPTFEEFLTAVAGRVPILVELKKNKGSRGLERIVIERLQRYGGEFAIQSFHPIAIRKVRKIDPAVYCGLLSSKFSDMKIMFLKKAAVKNARLFFMAKPDFISFEIKSFPNDRIAGFREELKMPILGWTIKTKEDIERAYKYCDGIIFENIENLKAHLLTR
ncbi:MAG: glycerophosphodiester phosphodiesterase [Clostridiales Family XIII bacterium]|jgi:glycerophosphoryl diester phosphodiesterase|nr:glycerophosphodiester phosphodiesterase [Clostridiales Family XIII bacterium]